MANQAVIFALAGTGGLLLVSAVTGTSLGDVLKGHPGKVSHSSLLSGIANSGVAGVGNAANTAAGNVTGGAPAGSSAGQVGQVSYSMLQQIGSKFGWSAAELKAWMQVIIDESGGNPTATNASSGAYGIAQGITGPSWYAAHGGNVNSVIGQLTAMANYISQRYGSPSAALAHENSYHWY